MKEIILHGITRENAERFADIILEDIGDNIYLNSELDSLIFNFNDVISKELLVNYFNFAGRKITLKLYTKEEHQYFLRKHIETIKKEYDKAVLENIEEFIKQDIIKKSQKSSWKHRKFQNS